MATVGNNFSKEPALFRDAFFTEEEVSYYEDTIIPTLKDGGKIDSIVSTLNTYHIFKIIDKIRKKLPDQTNEETKTMLNLILFQCTINDRMLNHLYNNVHTNLKLVLAETIQECVEEGMFDEAAMANVENFMAVLLGSIDDLHMERILELDMDR